MPDVLLTMRSSDPAEVLWERMLSTRGLCMQGSLADKRAGDAFSIETGAGDIFTGIITTFDPPRELTLVVENMHQSVLCVTTREIEDARTRLDFTLSAIGLHHDETDSFRSRWRLQLSDLFAGALTSG